EGRLAALDAAAAVIGRIKDYGLRDRYAVSLDRWLGMMDEDFVLARVRAHAPPAPGVRRPGRAGEGWAGGEISHRRDSDGRSGSGREDPGGEPGQDNGDGRPRAPEFRYDMSDPVIQLEREALKLAVQRPALCGPAFDAIGAESFSAPVHASVF